MYKVTFHCKKACCADTQLELGLPSRVTHPSTRDRQDVIEVFARDVSGGNRIIRYSSLKRGIKEVRRPESTDF